MLQFESYISYYRIFDIGPDVDLIKAQKNLDNSGSDTLKLKRNSKAMVIEDAPVVISLGQWIHHLAGVDYTISATGKLYSFGAISIHLKLVLPTRTTLTEIKNLVFNMENDPLLEELAKEKAHQLADKIKSSAKKIEFWDQIEDYMIVYLYPHGDEIKDYAEILKLKEIPEIILIEKDQKIAPELREHAIKTHLQYTEKDLIILDWNSAIICGNRDDGSDLSDVIEFALTQMLELRYYDDLLDRKLNSLYKNIQETKQSIFKNKYAKFAEESSLFYIEVSEIIEKIENSLKVIGDFYYAKVFRSSLEKFRTKDWQQSVDSKLTNLANISHLFNNETNERRSQLLEIVIIILISIEVIPFLIKVAGY